MPDFVSQEGEVFDDVALAGEEVPGERLEQLGGRLQEDVNEVLEMFLRWVAVAGLYMSSLWS